MMLVNDGEAAVRVTVNAGSGCGLSFEREGVSLNCSDDVSDRGVARLVS